MKNSTLNGGTVMMRNALIALLALSALALVACGEDPNNVHIEGVSGVAGSNVEWDPNQCWSIDECLVTEVCALDLQASALHGMDLRRCVTACTVDFVTVENEDGTSSTTKANDTCQRLGDESMYCDEDGAEGPVCTPYTAPVDPCADCNSDPDPDPEPVVDPEPAQFVEVSCCFNAGNLSGDTYAQLAWSTSTPEDPENFGKDGDLELDADGCFVSSGKVERSKLYFGFWTELTAGKVQSLDDNGDVVFGEWLGSGTDNEFAPLSCEVDGETVDVGGHMANCGFGFDEAVNVSCLN